MLSTIKSLIADGYTTYVENPRTAWIFLYPAQIVCYVTRGQGVASPPAGGKGAAFHFLKRAKGHGPCWSNGVGFGEGAASSHGLVRTPWMWGAASPWEHLVHAGDPPGI